MFVPGRLRRSYAIVCIYVSMYSVYVCVCVCVLVVNSGVKANPEPVHCSRPLVQRLPCCRLQGSRRSPPDELCNSPGVTQARSP